MLTRRDMLQSLGAAGVSVAALQAGVAHADMPANRTAPNFDVPAGACDCHVHVFDAKFPFAEKRIYTPPSASVEELLQLQQSLHLGRVVVVQPSVYAADNSATLNAIKRMGARARGVAVIDKSTSSAAIDDMAAAGVRGVRLNLQTTPRGKFVGE